MCGIFVSCCTESSIEDRTQELKRKDGSIARMEKNIQEKSNTIARLQSDVELLQARFQKPHLHVYCLFYSTLKIFFLFFFFIGTLAHLIFWFTVHILLFSHNIYFDYAHCHLITFNISLFLTIEKNASFLLVCWISTV